MNGGYAPPPARGRRMGGEGYTTGCSRWYARGMLISIPEPEVELTPAACIALRVIVTDWLQAQPDDRFVCVSEDVNEILRELDAYAEGHHDLVWDHLFEGLLPSIERPAEDPAEDNVIEFQPRQPERSPNHPSMRTPREQDEINVDLEVVVDMIADRVFDRIIERLETEGIKPPW